MFLRHSFWSSYFALFCFSSVPSHILVTFFSCLLFSSVHSPNTAFLLFLSWSFPSLQMFMFDTERKIAWYKAISGSNKAFFCLNNLLVSKEMCPFFYLKYLLYCTPMNEAVNTNLWINMAQTFHEKVRVLHLKLILPLSVEIHKFVMLVDRQYVYMRVSVCVCAHITFFFFPLIWSCVL